MSVDFRDMPDVILKTANKYLDAAETALDSTGDNGKEIAAESWAWIIQDLLMMLSIEAARAPYKRLVEVARRLPFMRDLDDNELYKDYLQQTGGGI